MSLKDLMSNNTGILVVVGRHCKCNVSFQSWLQISSCLITNKRAHTSPFHRCWGIDELMTEDTNLSLFSFVERRDSLVFGLSDLLVPSLLVPPAPKSTPAPKPHHVAGRTSVGHTTNTHTACTCQLVNKTSACDL